MASPYQQTHTHIDIHSRQFSGRIIMDLNVPHPDLITDMAVLSVCRHQALHPHAVGHIHNSPSECWETEESGEDCVHLIGSPELVRRTIVQQ